MKRLKRKFHPSEQALVRKVLECLLEDYIIIDQKKFIEWVSTTTDTVDTAINDIEVTFNSDVEPIGEGSNAEEE
jgi:hypothetical protein